MDMMNENGVRLFGWRYDRGMGWVGGFGFGARGFRIASAHHLEASELP